MKPSLHFRRGGGGNFGWWLFALGCLANGSLLCAQSAGGVAESAPTGDPPFVPAEKMHGKIANLIQGDARAIKLAGKPEPAPAAEKSDDDVLVLAPFQVNARKLPDLSPPVETRLDKFYRTGTLAEHVGKNVTTSVGVSRERGLTLDFRF